MSIGFMVSILQYDIVMVNIFDNMYYAIKEKELTS